MILWIFGQIRQIGSRGGCRLDRAINIVAEKFDKYEQTVQTQSIWNVYDGEG